MWKRDIKVENVLNVVHLLCILKKFENDGFYDPEFDGEKDPERQNPENMDYCYNKKGTRKKIER